LHELDVHRALYRRGTIVDVGAHDGAFTIPFAALAGAHVVAFEPLPTAFARLEAALRASPAAHVILHQAALGDRAATVVLEVAEVAGVAQEQWASIAKDYEAMRAVDPRIDRVERYHVPMLRLDDLALVHVTAMKIDAEGAEAEVLRGGAETLRRWRPLLSVEIEERHRPGSTSDVPAFLEAFGYEGWFELDGFWHPITGFDACRWQRASPSPADFDVTQPYVNCFYFLPPERRGELAALAQLPIV
jgi:FkbM family methyltransferase